MRRCWELFLVALLLASPLFSQSSIPEIPYDSAPNFLKLPEHVYLGEAAGVATNSKGHVFVYTRTGSVNVSTGTSRPFVRGGARLFEFDPKGTYVREIGQGLYGFVFAHAVRVDPQDNIWVVDEGANMVIKFNPEGRVVMTFGRKPETVTIPALPPESTPPPETAGGAAPFGDRGAGAGVLGDNFNRPTDVAWDAAGNLFISDGYGNSRVAKFDKNGRFIKTWGFRGKEAGQFNLPHSIAVDARGNVYVSDRENARIQVFDNDGNFKTQIQNSGRANSICISPGSHQYLYIAKNPANAQETYEILKMELDGTVLGKLGRTGTQLKEFNGAHALDCRNENELYVGETTNWRVQKITLRPSPAK